ncbi:hypothetical protein EJ110_NYTH45548 [Nymphaea thermarum]|nr:hypothetical protein EJ110_NYTH45548 [Nymphaea thermarum]
MKMATIEMVTNKDGKPAPKKRPQGSSDILMNLVSQNRILPSINRLTELPHFMKLCYLAVFNFINGIAYLALKKHGFDATEILKDEAELERGDVQPAVHCHMNEKGVEEEAALEHINSVQNQAWKKLNKECATAGDVPRALIDASVNLARVTYFFYKDGDGFGVSDGKTKEHIASLLVHPIPI